MPQQFLRREPVQLLQRVPQRQVQQQPEWLQQGSLRQAELQPEQQFLERMPRH